jgi:WD40 repeat protein
MAVRIGRILALALLLTCAPTAIPGSESGSPSASALAAIASDDLITLREGGSGSTFAVRKVSTSELVAQMADGVLLPDRTTVFAVEPSGTSTLLRLIDRRTGKEITSRTVAGTWVLGRGGSDFAGVSPNGNFIALLGSSYNFTDSSGRWTAKSTFAVIDTVLKRSEPQVVELEGRYAFDGISSDGRSLYVRENVPPQLPTSSRLRVYDLSTRAFGALATSDVSDLNDFTSPAVNVVAGGRLLTFQLLAGHGLLLWRDLDARTMGVAQLPADQVVTGEGVAMWSLTASRDGRYLYALNPAVGVVDEFDTSSLALRRAARLAQTRSERSLVPDLLSALHPVALAKRWFGSTAAVLSSDGGTLYALGETGVWKIDLASLKGLPLTKDGLYQAIAMSPDGARLYVLGSEDGVVRAISTRDGTTLGAMKRIAFPSDIIAVDPATK